MFNSGVKVLGQDQTRQVVNMFLILKNIPYFQNNLRYKTEKHDFNLYYETQGILVRDVGP